MRGKELQGLAAGLLATSQQVGAALGISLASVVASAIALAAGGDPSAGATTGYQATIYVALLLSVLAGALAFLAMRTPNPVAMSTSTREEQWTGAGQTERSS